MIAMRTNPDYHPRLREAAEDDEPCDVAWDCHPGHVHHYEPYDLGLDDEDGEGDWQVLALDRFGDRLVTY